jgi:hypothetical protein
VSTDDDLHARARDRESQTRYEMATGVVAEPAGESGWVSLRDHLEALRGGDDRRYAEVGKERDQRYAEVKAEQEKALVIKDTANRDALALARQDQTYKDEQANKLREQINSERGLYATKDDLANAVREMTVQIRPLAEYVSASAGRQGGEQHIRTEQRLNANLVVGMVALLLTAVIIAVSITVAAHGG